MVLMYSEKITPRLRYTVKWIMHVLNCEFAFTEDVEEYKNFHGAKIFYGARVEHQGDGIQIIPSGFLQEAGIRQFEPDVKGEGSEIVLFPGAGDTGYDLFSMVFYLISRYEEYLPFEADVYGRFKAVNSFAAKHQFLQEPVVDLRVNEFGKLLQEKFPHLNLQKPKLVTVFTYDIDVVFKYLARGSVKSCLLIGRDILTGKWSRMKERIAVLSGRKKDPWDVYDYIREELGQAGIKGIFFFLTAGGTEYDHNIDMSKVAVREKAFTKITDAEGVALHPSFYSSEREGVILKEKKCLEKYSARKIVASRQHFLKFRLPDTYRELIDAGITEDYSMAFAETPGFRAGTSRPFPFYDLLKEVETRLTVYPSCWMDATFVNYESNRTDDAGESALEFFRKVKSLGGMFIPIFHNDILEEEAILNIHKQLMQEAGQ